MHALIFLVLLVIVICFFKRFSNVVFFVAIFDILLRILTFLKLNTIKEIKTFISKYFPENIPDIIGNYAKGDLYTILVWVYVVTMTGFRQLKFLKSLQTLINRRFYCQILC